MNSKQLGRLAFRQEGNYWQAYYALTDTMEDAIPLSSIPMVLAQYPDVKEAFISLMQLCMNKSIEEVIGETPEWKESQKAPEHERSGNA